MAESTLTLDLAALRRLAGETFFGGSEEFLERDFSTQRRITQMIESGLRQFYDPPAVPRRDVHGRETRYTHQWSFLQIQDTVVLNAPQTSSTVTIVDGVVTLAAGTWPSWAASGVLRISGVDYDVSTRDSNTQLTLVDTTLDASAGTTYKLHQDDYDLADDFGYMIGPMTYSPSADSWYPVQIVGEGKIRELRQREPLSVSTDPYLAAIRQKENDPTVGTRSELLLWPSVNAAARLNYKYRARPNTLTTTNKYAYGVSDHAETIKASILAAGELLLQEQRGVYWQDFLDRLQASIEVDARNNRAQKVGYNRDCSDGEDYPGRHYQHTEIRYRGFGDL